MQCPLGHGLLVEQQHHGVRVSLCPACQGEWLDDGALASLEAAIVDDAVVLRGMLEYQPHPSERSCPVCGEVMHAFDYRGNSLEIDACGQGHGYWLDAGEETRVQELIRQRARDLHRAASAEASFSSFVDGLRRQFGGRGHRQ